MVAIPTTSANSPTMPSGANDTNGVLKTSQSPAPSANQRAANRPQLSRHQRARSSAVAVASGGWRRFQITDA